MCGVYSRLTPTVTVWPPGEIVSGSSRAARPFPVTVIVTLWPAWRVPDVCERLTPPSSWDGAEMDQLTGPPCAVSVNEPLPSPTIEMLFWETLSVPAVVEDDEPDSLPLEWEPEFWLEPELELDVDPEPEVDAAGDAEDDDELPPLETGTDELPVTGSADAGDGVPAVA
jgi:hypothetical protein